MIELQGWQVPASFTSADDEAGNVRESVGLADISWTLKYDLKGQGLKGRPTVGPEATWWPLGRHHGMITCEPPAKGAVTECLQQIQNARADHSLPLPFYVTNISSVFTHLLLAGPHSQDVLRKLTSLKLSDDVLGDSNCAQAAVAHVHAIVLRKNLRAIPAYQILVSREYGESVWESLLHAGNEFHITPFGLQARGFLEG